MIGVYKITNTLDGKFYVGASKDLNARKLKHFRINEPNNYRGVNEMHREMLRVGRDKFVFEVLEECSTEKLDEKEEYYIEKLKAVELGYNVSSKAKPMHDKKISEAHGNRLREWNLKQWENEEYRKNKSLEASLRQKERMKNKEYYEEKVAIMKKYTDSIKKRVAQYDMEGNFIAEYEGVRVAERATGVSSQMISKVAKGQKYRKSAGGFVWKYIP